MPNPALETGDVIEVAYPDGRSEQQIINSLGFSLGVSNALTLTTRSGDGRAGRSADGQADRLHGRDRLAGSCNFQVVA